MKYLLLITTMILTVSLSAQRGERGDMAERGERLEQQRIAHITTELDLTVEEAQDFWPIYNKYHSLRKENNLDKREKKEIEQLSEQEAESMLDKELSARKRQSELDLDFINELKGVLPDKKRLKLLRVEREFKKKVLKRFQKRMKRDGKRKEKIKERQEMRDEK